MDNIMSWLKQLIDNLSPQHDIYLISDTHFDEPWFSCHRGFSRHCGLSSPGRLSNHRWFSSVCPFNNLGEMNKILVDNWNKTVRKDDTVYFIGDWHEDEDKNYDEEKDRQYWQSQLNGKILSIKGNHDHNTCETKYPYYRRLPTAKREYLLVHDPYYRRDWHGWRIHGHHHNNDLYNYPFINGDKKTINVSVEVIGYKPISINWIEALHLSTIKEMKTFDSVPVRWRHTRRLSYRINSKYIFISYLICI
jgi:calcineurin-like phosphoesterase family protein